MRALLAALLSVAACTGSQGTQGPAGLQGATGAQGQAGTQGSQGPTGATGQQGPPGLPYSVYGGGGSSLTPPLGAMLGMSGGTITYADTSTAHYIWTLDVGDGHPIFPQVTLYFASGDCSGTPYAATNPPPQLLVAPNPADYGNSFPFTYYARDPSAATGVALDARSKMTSSCAAIVQGFANAYKMMVAGQQTQFGVSAAPITYR
jgi:hypothetical protein